MEWKDRKRRDVEGICQKRSKERQWEIVKLLEQMEKLRGNASERMVMKQICMSRREGNFIYLPEMADQEIAKGQKKVILKEPYKCMIRRVAHCIRINYLNFIKFPKGKYHNGSNHVQRHFAHSIGIQIF